MDPRENLVVRATLLIACAVVAMGAFVIWRASLTAPPGTTPSLVLEALMGGTAVLIASGFFARLLLATQAEGATSLERRRAALGKDFTRKKVTIVHLRFTGTGRLVESLDADNAGELVAAFAERIRRAAHRRGAEVEVLTDREARLVFGLADLPLEQEPSAVMCAMELLAILRDFKVKGRHQQPISLGVHAGVTTGFAVVGRFEGRMAPVVLGDVAQQAEATLVAAITQNQPLFVTSYTLEPLREDLDFETRGFVNTVHANLKAEVYLVKGIRQAAEGRLPLLKEA